MQRSVMMEMPEQDGQAVDLRNIHFALWLVARYAGDTYPVDVFTD